jgi:hypothetical protein
MKLPQNCGSGLRFPCVSPDTSNSHITQAPVSWPPRHYLVSLVTFLVLVCAQNLHGHCGPCLQSFFTHVVKKFCNPSSFTDPEVVILGQTLGRHNQTAGCVSLGKGQNALPRWNVKSQTIPQIFGIINPPVPKTDTQGQKICTRQFSFHQEGTS